MASVAAQLREALADADELGAVRGGVGEVDLVIADHLIGVMGLPGNFRKAKRHRIGVGEGLLQPEVVIARRFKLFRIQIRDGAVEEGVVVVGLHGQHLAESRRRLRV